MPPTKRDLDAYLNRQHDQAPKFGNPELLRSAAVQAEALTGRPEWDRYLHLLQAKLDSFKKQYEDWREQLEYAKTEDRVKECQINTAVFKNCALVVEEAMQLPATIIREHQERRDA